MNEDIRDQIDLCKTALRKAMGHLARMEQLMKSTDKILGNNDQEGEVDYIHG